MDFFAKNTIQLKSSAFFLSVLLGSQIAFAEATSCSAFFSDSTAETDFRTDRIQAKAEHQALIRKYDQPASIMVKVWSTAWARRYKILTDSLTRKNKLSYPFSHMKSGDVQKIRYWAKTGDEAVYETIDRWIHRYGSYKEDRNRVLERTVLIRAEYNMIESFLKRPPSEFPVTVSILKTTSPTPFSETVKFQTVSEVKAHLEELKKVEHLRFDYPTHKDFQRGRFLDGRNEEQALLGQRLRIILTELKKFPRALMNEKMRSEHIAQVEKLLSNPELTPPPKASLVQARRTLLEELAYYRGSHREYLPAGEEATRLLRFNDRRDLGIESPGLALGSRVRRWFWSTLPAQGLVGLGLISLPMATDYAKDKVLAGRSVQEFVQQKFMTDLTIQELAELPQSQYENSVYRYLQNEYHLHVENEKLIFSDEAKEVLTRIQTARAEHLQELKKEKISEQTFSQVLGEPMPLSIDH